LNCGGKRRPGAVIIDKFWEPLASKCAINNLNSQEDGKLGKQLADGQAAVYS
jgi:hypothetical protein